MDASMQDRPLTIAHIFERAERLFARKTIVGSSPAGTTSITYAQWAGRVRRLATALDLLGVPEGARVATFANNSQQHLELYFAVPITKRVVHTINIRLADEHLRYIIDHAADDVVFVDRGLLARLWPLADSVASVRHWIVLPDGTDAALPADPRVHDYEDLIASAAPTEGSFADAFVLADEGSAAGLCFSSGTTGLPKGVVYSHRSTVLHCMMTLSAGLLGLEERDTVMPVVPMFHANAWGLPHGAIMAGADLVMPGASMAPHDLLSLIADHGVTVTAGVPTVWNSMAPLLTDYDLSTLRMVLGGGSAIAPALSQAWQEGAGVPITHSWGMTEASPVAVVGGTRSWHDDLDEQSRLAVRSAQGQSVPLVDLRIVDVETGRHQPWDGAAIGELQVAGPWIASGYLNHPAPDAFTADGWLRTGDMATIDEDGYLRLVDRLKDLIKSGGEWISSVDLESALVSHPDIVEAAVIARPDVKWVERPVACIVRRPDSSMTAEDVIAHLRPLVATWWLPDEVVFMDDLPKTGTGKLSKVTLRSTMHFT
ncbi:long-chain fatty acid--CoA ligase [Aeromicrobium endophyticum]|uniref:Fatty acid--CoA ligase n=1 Tax=Aeromicrobium endophyticum TaxID=2292704 RepID=A0A371PCH7_9ACTN|nr:long-chain fatty acid--CoA ligase [Aeromicrobium endophyticum]REK73090.1 fatty acid--CoA ligase [Aeromicrobium endophyticum]